MAASSLLSPNLISSNPKALNLSSPLLLSKPSLSFSVSPSFVPLKLGKRGLGLGLGFVRKVAAVSSEYEEGVEEEEEEEVGSGVDASFSPDLKLFVGNLPFSVDSSELAGLLGSAGNVEMVEVIYDKLTGKSRGFGFVTMSTVEEVEAACQQFNGYHENDDASPLSPQPKSLQNERILAESEKVVINPVDSKPKRKGSNKNDEEYKGRTLRVNSGPPPPREERPSRGFRSGGGGGGGSFDAANRLYVGNLSWGVDNLALETLFSEQGKVMDAKVVYDRESGRSRGFGFVTYNTAEEANNAISNLDGSDLDGRTIRVTVAEARPPRREF